MAKVPPLSWQTPIVDADSGKPTSFFIRLWQQLFSIQYIRIVADRTIIKYDSAGTAIPSSQTSTFTAVKTNSSDTTTWTMKDNLGNPLDITLYSTGYDTDVVTVTRIQFDAAIAVNGSSGINIIASVVDAGETFRDEASLTKVQDGATGTGLDARILTVICDKQTIIYDGAGTPTPSTQTVTFETNKVNTSATVYWTIQDLLGNNLTPVTTYLSASSGDTVTMTRSQFEAAIAVNGARGVVVTGTLTDSGTYVDRISVVKVLGGADGPPGSTGSPGSPGSPGITPLSMSALPNPITVGCTNNGTPKAAIPDFTVTVLQGTTDVTASVTWSFTDSGLTGTARAGAVFSATGMTADTGYITVTATYGGASARLTVTYTKTLDGAAFVTETTIIDTPLGTGTTSYTTSPVSLLMGPNGTLDVDGNGTFNHGGGGSVNINGYAEYSLDGGGSWSTLSGSTFTGNPSLGGLDGDYSFLSSVSGSSIGLTTKQTVIVQARIRKTGAAALSSHLGTMSVSWTG